ncbi:shikimate kinase [Streptomyces sparsogenes]
MGVGKTTVGRVLAERLGTGFRDTDTDIVETAGKQISEIFIDEGEPHFRELERRAVHAAVAEHRGVLALGGGAILDEGTRALLADLPVVFLEMGVAEAVKRTGLDAPRPLLAVNPRQRWRELMEQRRPLYTEVARAVVSTEGRTPEDVADAVLDALELKDA